MFNGNRDGLDRDSDGVGAKLAITPSILWRSWNQSQVSRSNQESPMMSASSLCFDVSNQFADDPASRVYLENNREAHREAIDLRDEVLSTARFEEIVGFSDAIRVTAQLVL
jgi:hypothetical protein